MEGILRKMAVSHSADSIVRYTLRCGENDAGIDLNEKIGQEVRLTWLQKMSCIHCGRGMKKSFSQGYCYPCSQRLAEADLCVVRPSTCRYDAGGCRDAEWGRMHCMIPHVVYLANSSGLKVGITRSHHRFTRWMDQGASAAIVLGVVTSRKQAGEIEDLIAKNYKDKTDWRKLLRGDPEPIDLLATKQKILEEFGLGPIGDLQPATDDVTTFRYPVVAYPEKVVSLNLEKDGAVSGVLQGIKGQYLIFDKGVINIRKYTGYHIVFETVERDDLMPPYMVAPTRAEVGLFKEG